VLEFGERQVQRTVTSKLFEPIAYPKTSGGAASREAMVGSRERPTLQWTLKIQPGSMLRLNCHIFSLREKVSGRRRRTVTTVVWTSDHWFAWWTYMGEGRDYILGRVCTRYNPGPGSSPARIRSTTQRPTKPDTPTSST